MQRMHGEALSSTIHGRLGCTKGVGMKKTALLMLMFVVLMLVFVPSALAATPQDIYDDYADNLKLDGTYTPEELKAYLNDPVIHQYGKPDITEPLDSLIRQQLKDRPTFPFTGFQILLVSAGAVALIVIGVLLRRQSRRDPSA